jgi:hypothetical protein
MKDYIVKFIVFTGCLFSLQCASKKSPETSSLRLVADTDEIVRFEVISCEDTILHRNTPACRDIRYGFEGGRIVKIGNTYHWITPEMAGDPQNVNMRIGYWTSTNGTDWQRQRTLRVSDGDFTGVSQHAAVWGPMVVFIEEENRWHLFYVYYKAKPIFSNYHGIIQHAVSEVAGMEGIGGPYTDREVLMRYENGNPDPWEGDQGTDSFFPYKIGNQWYAFYGSATITPEGVYGNWKLGLAQADHIEGPWVRMTEHNPVDVKNFAENPIVFQLENGVYIAIVDGGPWVNKMGYTLSWDGIHWSSLRYFEIEPTVQKWWKNTRTPLSLIKEEDGSYTMFFTAFKPSDNGRVYGALSKLKLKLTFVP